MSLLDDLISKKKKPLPVNISIKDDPQISLVIKNCLSYSFHCCLVLRVWNMIWKQT